jgi:hypothetical protein
MVVSSSELVTDPTTLHMVTANMVLAHSYRLKPAPVTRRILFVGGSFFFIYGLLSGPRNMTVLVGCDKGLRIVPGWWDDQYSTQRNNTQG